MTGKPRAAATPSDIVDEARTPPGLQSLLLAAVSIGILMLAVQLWLLTVALDLYLGGQGGEVVSLAVISGAIFVAGLVALRALSRGERPSR
jgi:hypothetical protein